MLLYLEHQKMHIYTNSMLQLQLIYDENSKNILDNLQKNWSNYEIIGLDINNADHKNKIKKLKSHFASELIPFLGVFDDKETLMGFYSEKTHKYEQTQKCSWDQINTWLKTYYENNTTIL